MISGGEAGSGERAFVKSCPACTNVIMQHFVDRHSQLEIDSCPECFGLWFDSEELKLFFESTDLSHRILSEDAAASLSQTSTETSAPVQDARNCPVCREGLFISRLGETQVDYCLGCRGIWLDRRELEDLVTAFQGGERGNLLIVNQLIEGLGTPLRPNPKAASFLEALQRYRSAQTQDPP